MKENINIEDIGQYLEGKLTEAEAQQFEHRMDSDPEFAALVNDYKLAVRSVEFYGKSLLKHRLHEIHQEEKLQRQKKIRMRWMSIAAVFIGLMVLGIPLLFNLFKSHTDYQQLFADNFSLYPDLLNHRGHEQTNNLMLEEAMSYYKNKDFENAVALFGKLGESEHQLADVILFYKGVSLLGAGKVELASDVFKKIIGEPEKIFYEQARWYFALCLIKTENIEEATEVLKKIVGNKSYNFSKAIKLIEQLE